MPLSSPNQDARSNEQGKYYGQRDRTGHVKAQSCPVNPAPSTPCATQWCFAFLMAAPVVRSHEITTPCNGLLVQGPGLCSRLRRGPPPGFAFPVALHPHIRPVWARTSFRMLRQGSWLVSLYRMDWFVAAMLLTAGSPPIINV